MVKYSICLFLLLNSVVYISLNINLKEHLSNNSASKDLILIANELS